MNEWLDKIIAEQAAYYGMEVGEFTKAIGEMAEIQEDMEAYHSLDC